MSNNHLKPPTQRNGYHLTEKLPPRKEQTPMHPHTMLFMYFMCTLHQPTNQPTKQKKNACPRYSQPSSTSTSSTSLFFFLAHTLSYTRSHMGLLVLFFPALPPPIIFLNGHSVLPLALALVLARSQRLLFPAPPRGLDASP